MSTKAILGTLILACGFAASCARSQSPETAPAAEMVPEQGAAPAEVEPSSDEPAAIEWAAMNEAQRKTYMKDVVMPKMAQVLQSGAPEEFEEVTCATCHGSSAKSGAFEMPNPELHVLDPADGFAADKKKHPEMFEFMATQVVPEMATLLGVAPYDPATQEGFGCFHCHTMKQ